MEKEDFTRFIELLLFKWGMVETDMVGSTVTAEEYIAGEWKEQEIEFTIKDHLMPVVTTRKTNIQSNPEAMLFTEEIAELDMIIDLYLGVSEENKLVEDFIFVADELANFLSENLVGLEYFIRLVSTRELGLQFVIPMQFTTESEIFHYLVDKENREELLRQYVTTATNILLFMFVQESDEKIKGLIQLRNPLKVILVASEKKSFTLSLYRNSKRITLPLPKWLVLETRETLEHYRELQRIGEAFLRIDEIYEDKITKKGKQENANIVEFLVEMNIHEFVKKY